MRTILKLLTAAAAFTLISAVIVLFSGCNTETDYGYSVRFVYENSSECDIRVMQVYTSTIVGSVTAGDTLEIIHLAPGETEEFFHEAMGVWPVDLIRMTTTVRLHVRLCTKPSSYTTGPIPSHMRLPTCSGISLRSRTIYVTAGHIL